MLTWGSLGDFTLGHRRAGGNPFLNRRDFIHLQRRPLRRHPIVQVLGGQPIQKLAVRRVAGGDNRFPFRPLPNVRRRVDAQSHFLFQRAVTGITPRL